MSMDNGHDIWPRRENRRMDVDALIQDLVIANRILASEEVVDAYGHVSVRHPDNPNRFLIARSLAPELVGPEDIVDPEVGLLVPPDDPEALASALASVLTHPGAYPVETLRNRALEQFTWRKIGETINERYLAAVGRPS